jgi:hypothetical protein
MNLFESIPEDYSIFGNFGESVWQEQINEGLITSYPREKVVQYIKGLNIPGVQLTLAHSIDTSTINVIVDILDNSTNIKKVTNIIDKGLTVYGYFIGKTSTQYGIVRYKLLIEAKYPTLLSDKEKLDAPFYHITYNFYAEKIEKNGLSPRSSSTVFTHPGGRIYLLQTGNPSLLNILKERLSSSKREKMSKEGIPNAQRFYPMNMVVYEVDVSGDLYKDPMFPDEKSYNAVFTTKNIPPDKLKKTSY